MQRALDSPRVRPGVPTDYCRAQRTSGRPVGPRPGGQVRDALADRPGAGDPLADDLGAVELACVDPAIELAVEFAHPCFDVDQQGLLLVDEPAVDAPQRQDETRRAKADDEGEDGETDDIAGLEGA